MLIKLLNKNKNYIIKNVMRFKFLIIKKFSGGVVGEPGFPTISKVRIYNGEKILYARYFFYLFKIFSYTNGV